MAPLPGSRRPHTLGPVKLPHVHVGLNDGDDRLALQLYVGVKELLVEHAVHACNQQQMEVGAEAVEGGKGGGTNV